MFPACDLVLDKQGVQLTVSEFVVDGFLVSGTEVVQHATGEEGLDEAVARRTDGLCLLRHHWGSRIRKARASGGRCSLTVARAPGAFLRG